MARYKVTLTGRTGWDGHLTEQQYEVEAKTPEAAIEAGQAAARQEYQYEHANSGMAVAERVA